jgi:hypothetical protein
MRCPLCLSDNLVEVTECPDGTSLTYRVTQCCEDCGGSFHLIQESQDFPIDKQELVEIVDKANNGDKNPYTLEKILSYLQKDIIHYIEDYDSYRIVLGKGNVPTANT